MADPGFSLGGEILKVIGGSKGAPGTRALCPRDQILSFSCSFRQKIRKIIPIWELAHPRRENPGSATESAIILQFVAENCTKILKK